MLKNWEDKYIIETIPALKAGTNEQMFIYEVRDSWNNQYQGTYDDEEKALEVRKRLKNELEEFLLVSSAFNTHYKSVWKKGSYGCTVRAKSIEELCEKLEENNFWVTDGKKAFKVLYVEEVKDE